MESVAERVRELAGPRQRRQLAAARVQLRRPTSAARLLPTVLLIGGQRCGTSSLFKYLAGHPDLGAPVRKEVDYFARHYSRGDAWYRAHFPLRTRRLVRRGLITFEATPDYLFDPRSPARAAQLLPDARLVVLLRDPVARAWSHHQHMTRLRFEELPFEEAVEAEPTRLAGELDRMAADPFYDCRPFRRYSYVSRGFYAGQLERWQRYFPASSFLVIRSEDFFSDPPSSVRKVLAFTGLRPWRPASFRNFSYRTPSAPRASGPPDGARSLLSGTFTAENRRLAALVGWQSTWVE